MCSAASQDGMSLGVRVRHRGGWGQIPTSPSFSPVFWLSGRGFHADLALWCPFARVGLVLDPHPVLVRGGGGALRYRNRCFYILFLLCYWVPPPRLIF